LDRPLVNRTIMQWRRLLHSAFRLGDEKNAERVLGVATNAEAPVEVRLEALRLLQEWAKPHPVDQSLGRWSPLPDRDPKGIAGVLNDRVADLFKLEGKLLEPA